MILMNCSAVQFKCHRLPVLHLQACFDTVARYRFHIRTKGVSGCSRLHHAICLGCSLYVLLSTACEHSGRIKSYTWLMVTSLSPDAASIATTSAQSQLISQIPKVKLVRNEKVQGLDNCLGSLHCFFPSFIASRLENIGALSRYFNIGGDWLSPSAVDLPSTELTT